MLHSLKIDFLLIQLLNLWKVLLMHMLIYSDKDCHQECNQQKEESQQAGHLRHGTIGHVDMFMPRCRHIFLLLRLNLDISITLLCRLEIKDGGSFCRWSSRNLSLIDHRQILRAPMHNVVLYFIKQLILESTSKVDCLLCVDLERALER